MLPNLGPGELIVIMAVALIVFGPKKLPEIGKGIGKAMREFNKARNDFMDSINTDLDHEPVPARSAATVSDAYPSERKLEYPEPLDAESVDALPYGSDFQAVEGDSQPSFRTAEPEPTPATAAAGNYTSAEHQASPQEGRSDAGEGKA
jgi:sec-independent protein translocase protein TatA